MAGVAVWPWPSGDQAHGDPGHPGPGLYLSHDLWHCDTCNSWQGTVTVWRMYDGMAHDSFYVLPHDSDGDQVASVSDSKMLDSPRYLQHRLSIIREVSEESSASSTPHTSPKRNFSNYYLGSKSSNSHNSRATSPITRNRSPSPVSPVSPATDEQYLSEKFRWHTIILYTTQTFSVKLKLVQSFNINR